jgi:hypothetical protein
MKRPSHLRTCELLLVIVPNLRGAGVDAWREGFDGRQNKRFLVDAPHSAFVLLERWSCCLAGSSVSLEDEKGKTF